MPRVWDPYPYPLFGYAPDEPGWIVNSKDMERELPMWLVACRVRWLDSVRRTVARFLYIIALDASTHALFTGGVVASARPTATDVAPSRLDAISLIVSVQEMKRFPSHTSLSSHAVIAAGPPLTWRYESATLIGP